MADSDHAHDQIDDATLARYLTGSSHPEEAARVERWLEADPAHRDELAVLRAAWNPGAPPEADSADTMWQWIAERMDAPLARPTVVRGGYGPHPSHARRSGLVAAAAIFLAVGALLVQQLGGFRSAASARSAAPAMRELATSRGERANGNLPDGSRVILAPESRLRIPATFAATPTSGATRDLYLEGEAFFVVTHDSTRPFRVHTASGIAEDLGTEFVVTAYPETRATRVVVQSGRVALGKGLTLAAGDLGRVDAAGMSSVRHGVDVAAYVGWTKGTLAFDEAPLDEALGQLARWYDLEIRLADPALGARRFTATFHDEPVARVLRTLEVALDVRAVQRGRLVTIGPSGPRTAPDR